MLLDYHPVIVAVAGIVLFLATLFLWACLVIKPEKKNESSKTVDRPEYFGGDWFF